MSRFRLNSRTGLFSQGWQPVWENKYELNLVGCKTSNLVTETAEVTHRDFVTWLKTMTYIDQDPIMYL